MVRSLWMCRDGRAVFVDWWGNSQEVGSSVVLGYEVDKWSSGRQYISCFSLNAMSNDSNDNNLKQGAMSTTVNSNLDVKGGILQSRRSYTSSLFLYLSPPWDCMHFHQLQISNSWWVVINWNRQFASNIFWTTAWVILFDVSWRLSWVF